MSALHDDWKPAKPNMPIGTKRLLRPPTVVPGSVADLSDEECEQLKAAVQRMKEEVASCKLITEANG